MSTLTENLKKGLSHSLKILCDRHHSGLTDSLILLFQKRLGWEIWFQKGMEWYPDFWNLQPFESTAVQYLERELEGLPGITLEDFKNTKFDVLLCSVPQHIEPFKKLIELYQPEAKLIFQIGNAWNVPEGLQVKNVLASAIVPNVPEGVNFVQYHQEFSLDTFHCAPPVEDKKIYSFINCLNTVDLYKKDWELFLELEKLMPEWEFKSFGGQCRDGSFNHVQGVADKMREATFIFQVKNQGDGYGHNIFGAAAVGRPIITRFSDYKDKLAEPLISHQTSVIIDGRTPLQIAEHIEALHYFNTHSDIINSPITANSMAVAINQKFTETVNFDKEQKLIEEFLAKLQ